MNRKPSKISHYLLPVLFLALAAGKSAACEVCQNNQPKGLQNVTHGTGPQGTVDFIIIWSAVAIVAVTLFFSLKFLIRPKENSPGHIKNIVVENM